ncbi:MAG: AAA family ATPase [Planctomycetota bacterium]
MDRIREGLEGQMGTVQRQLEAIFAGDMLEGPNGEAVQAVRETLQSCAAAIDRDLQRCIDRAAETRETVAEQGRQLVLVHQQQEMAFQELIEKHKEAQAKATERSQLERRRNALLAREREKQQLGEQLQTLRDEREGLLDALSEARNERFEIRRRIVERINGTLAPSIRVSLVQFGNPAAYEELLKDALRGHRLQHGRVAGKIVNAFWPGELAEAVEGKDAQALIRKAELNAEQAGKVLSALSDPQMLFALEAAELADKPTIELNDGGVYKESSSLSTGQKCTAILPILLMDSESPLLIDQPEDNLDNRFVYEAIVESISKVKTRRQLIFVTHNPNIPVLGEADRVFVLESDGTLARKRDEGTVDQCRRQIVTLLEGGEEAFQRRKSRYQY